MLKEEVSVSSRDTTRLFSRTVYPVLTTLVLDQGVVKFLYILKETIVGRRSTVVCSKDSRLENKGVDAFLP